MDFESKHQQLCRRPFEPFRLVTTEGDRYEITRLNQAVAMKRRVALTPDGERLKFVPLAQVVSVELLGGSGG